MSNFSNLNLKQTILDALESKGYQNPTPIQEAAIPCVLEKKDVLGIAQTGTGKTAAFSLPILHLLSENNEKVRSNHIRCLILTPTRELASQIADNIENYGKNLNLNYAVIFGGVGENPQINKLNQGLDIVIATPGRLLDLANQGFINFSKLEIFVLDEADRMLDMGFIVDIERIIAKLPKIRQNLLFSATMPQTIAHLANSILKNPIKIEITPPATTVERIDQKVYLVERSNKTALLKHIIEQNQEGSILVFLQTKNRADILNDFLEKNSIKVETIHGDKSQSARELALQNFRDGKAHVLIATDIAARGIDIAGISHVVNYDIPADPESYVHRIGRTARAGREGIAISFCDPTETMALKAIEKTINYKIPLDKNHPFHGAHGISGVRKISSAKQNSANINSKEENNMTNQTNNLQSGRRISSGADNSSSTNFSEKSERPARSENQNRNRNHHHKNHNKHHNDNKNHHKKKGLIAKIVEKLKAIFGGKKPAKPHYHHNKKRRPNNNSRGRNNNRRPASKNHE